MKTVSTEEIRELDRKTIEEAGVPGDLLMERAGQGVAEIILDVLETRMGQTALLIAGTGNNGGDIFAAATFLAATEMDIEVWICGGKQKIKGDAEYHLKKMMRSGITPKEIQSTEDLDPKWAPTVIADGLLGTGATGAPRGFMSEVVQFINKEGSRCFVLAVDIPTGVNSDTGIAEGPAVKADLTATFALPKTGLIKPEALPYVGNIEVIDIGIPDGYVEETEGCREAELIDWSDLSLPRRGNDNHKGHYGHLLLMGGSIGYAGAIAMAAQAALRSGAGLVSVLTPEDVYSVVAELAGPEVMVHPVADYSQIPNLLSTEWSIADAILVGPGLPQNPDLIEKIATSSNVPVVLDAGALCISPSVISNATCPIVITPHPGEFKRMFGEPVTDRWGQARSAAEQIHQTVILKGAGTVVASPGEKLGINLTGNPGMAAAGSGDVLSGILTALLGQGIEPGTAARTAVYLHGLAGDLAAELVTQESLIATDIIETLPDAIYLVKYAG